MVETHGGRRFALVILLLALLVLLTGRWLKPVDNVALSAAAPFAAGITGASTAVGDLFTGIFQGPSLRAQNLKLEHKMAVLIRRNLTLQSDAYENKLLRRMLNYQDANDRLDLLRARVIYHDPTGLSPYFIINQGSQAHLTGGMSVLDENGYFVGSLSDVTANAAKVLPMISASSSISGMDLETRASGLVQGQYRSDPRINFIKTSQTIHRGDWVVTTGELNLYPRMLLMGQVVSVQRSDVQEFQTVELQPAADFQNLEMVQVIRAHPPGVPLRLITPRQ
ncbi:MAG: rod shape-determining protein MreC [Chloroflexota bacterium]